MLIYKKKIPIYFGELLIVFNDDFEESLKKFKVSVENNLHGCGAISIPLEHNKTGVSRYMILFKDSPGNNTIAHEALHTTNFILGDRGVKADYDNDEAQAYLLGYIVGEICKFLDKHNK